MLTHEQGCLLDRVEAVVSYLTVNGLVSVWTWAACPEPRGRLSVAEAGCSVTADEGARISGALTSLSEVLSLGRSGLGVKTIYPAAALSGFES